MRVNRSIADVKNFFNFTGKVAVITGGSGGFGKAAAIGLAAYGADVVITSRKLDSLEDTAEEIRKLGRKVLPISCDVGDEASINAMIAKVIEELGKIDILITAAGIANRFPAEEFPIDEWQNIMDINVKGTFLCCQAAGKQMMKQGGGKIITVSSVRGLLGHPGGYAAYGTSKGAVSLLTRQLAVEWAKYNINVNSIAPCIFWTPLTKQVLEDEQLYTLFMERIPMGRAAEPEDFIGSVLLLSSGASDMITGHILYVDGGNTAG
jgi:gluconate 5-dehydrogenase